MQKLPSLCIPNFFGVFSIGQGCLEWSLTDLAEYGPTSATVFLHAMAQGVYAIFKYPNTTKKMLPQRNRKRKLFNGQITSSWPLSSSCLNLLLFSYLFSPSSSMRSCGLSKWLRMKLGTVDDLFARPMIIIQR